MSDHYDVIIVGSGAGGGTLAHRLAPSGKRVLILERGDWLPREIGELGRRGGLRRQPLRLDRPLVRRARQAVPAPGALLRRRRDEVLRRRAVPAAGARLRRAQAPRRDLTGLADRLQRARALLHAGRGALPGARRPGRGPDRAAGVGAVPLSPGLARAPHPAALRRPDPGRAPSVPLALRHHARRGRARLQPVHPVRDLRRLRVPGARQVRRRGGRRTTGDASTTTSTWSATPSYAGSRPTSPVAR